MEYEIVFFNEDYMVVNKPAGVVVNRAESVGTETVQDWVEKKMSSRVLYSKRGDPSPCHPEFISGSIPNRVRDDRGRVQDDKIDTGLPRGYARNDGGLASDDGGSGNDGGLASDDGGSGNDGGEGNDEILFRKRSGICHRLDKETSGCLLIAKNPAALIHALKEFKERRVEKEYLALVHGLVNPKEGTMRLPLARTRFDREKFEVRYSGKMAETSWKVEKYFKDTTLIRLFPKTGRTHQIRVHLSHMGYPIWSDERYLRKDFLVEDRKQLSHHFLHAEVLRLKGVSGEMIEARAKLPEDELQLISWIS